MGGNARSLLFACVAPTSTHRNETLSTLQFAAKSKTIVNQVREVSERMPPTSTAAQQRKLAEWKAKKRGLSVHNGARTAHTKKAVLKRRRTGHHDKENASVTDIAARMSRVARLLAAPGVSEVRRQQLQRHMAALSRRLARGGNVGGGVRGGQRNSAGRAAARAARSKVLCFDCLLWCFSSIV